MVSKQDYKSANYTKDQHHNKMFLGCNIIDENKMIVSQPECDWSPSSTLDKTSR